MPNLAILQSGFVTAHGKGFVLPNPSEPTAREAVIFKEYSPPLVNYFYSKDVTLLFTDWCSNPNNIRSFEFRERILKTAYVCFGERYFRKWLDIQTESNALSALHGKFILETLEYIVNSVPRRVQTVQWINLLEAEEKSKAVPVKVEEFLKLRPGTNKNASIPSEISDLLIAWTKRRDGFEDLLISLHVIFGGRNRQTNVSDLAG